MDRSRAVTTAPTEDRLSRPMRNYLTIVDTLKANKGAEAKAIQAMLSGDKRLMDSFLAMAFSLLQSRPDVLADCTPESLIQCVKDGAALGLVPLTEDAAIVPYGTKSGEKVAKLMPMWRGYVKRIRNSREVADLDVQIVYMNDQFELELGTEPKLRHVPALYGEKDDSGAFIAERGDFRGVYAWAQMPTGKYIIEWMTTDDINYVRDTWGNKTSASGRDLPWNTSWAEMARKTVIRRLAKRLPAAAVDKLLELDKGNDDAVRQLELVATKADTALDEVRQLALRAVGQLPAGEAPATTNEDAAKDAEGAPGQPPEGSPPEDPTPPPTSQTERTEPVAGMDPDVAAAMRLNDEQQQLARQRQAAQRR